MIETLTIDRFKSIQSLTIPCRKVNVFIGAPDTGKTNILESLSFVARLGWGLPLDASLRLRPELGFEPLFYRQFFDQPLQISMHLDSPQPAPGDVEEISVRAAISGADRGLTIEFLPWKRTDRIAFGDGLCMPKLDWIRPYSYSSSERWRYDPVQAPGDRVVLPPDGPNLLYIARHDQRVNDFLKETVSGLNWLLRFDQAHKTFRLSEVRKDEILDYNLDLLSDSLKRLFFYGAIVLTSASVTLVLDEPDVFAFPPYPRTLAEMIAEDASNQFFLTTHNPYFLLGVLEKTPHDNLALFVCYRKPDGASGAKLLGPNQVTSVIEQGANVFFNLDAFLEC